MNDPHAHCGSGGGGCSCARMVPAGARARVLVLSALAALPAGAGPAGLPKQPLPKLLAATDARVASLAPPGFDESDAPRALVVARERRLTTDYAQPRSSWPRRRGGRQLRGSVAIDGDTVVDRGAGTGTAAARSTSSARSDGGATYVEVAKLTGPRRHGAGDEFGRSVAIDGDTVVVGANSDDSYGGAVYVFRTSDGGATYGQVAKLTAADAAANDDFGGSVAIDGDTVVVGAYGRRRRLQRRARPTSSARPTAAPRTARWPS